MKRKGSLRKESQQNSVDALAETVLDASVDELKSKEKLGVRLTCFDDGVFQNPNIMPYLYSDEKRRAAEVERQKDI